MSYRRLREKIAAIEHPESGVGLPIKPTSSGQPYQKIDRNKPTDYLGISQPTRDKLLKTGEVDPKSIIKIENCLMKNTSLKDIIQEDMLTDDWSIEDFVEKIGAPLKVADAARRSAKDTFAGFRPPKIKSDKFPDIYSELAGLYYFYRVEEGNSGEKLIVRGVIHVRSMLESGGADGTCEICCALTTPVAPYGYEKITDTRRVFEYYGNICRRDSAIYWFFDQDAASREDFIYMVTVRRLPFDGHYTGIMTTMNQDTDMKPISSPVSIRRATKISKNINDRQLEIAEHLNFLRREPVFLSPSDLDDDDILDDLGIRPPPINVKKKKLRA